MSQWLGVSERIRQVRVGIANSVIFENRVRKAVIISAAIRGWYFSGGKYVGFSCWVYSQLLFWLKKGRIIFVVIVNQLSPHIIRKFPQSFVWFSNKIIPNIVTVSPRSSFMKTRVAIQRAACLGLFWDSLCRDMAIIGVARAIS